jgi:hypothetical protein
MITISIMLANIMQGVDNTILLISVVREMRATVFRTARSVAIYEGGQGFLLRPIRSQGASGRPARDDAEGL